MNLEILRTALRTKVCSDTPPSTPTLPAFNSVSDTHLVPRYIAERRKGPAAFDKKTVEIEKSLTATKKRRGGSSFLIHGDYIVELASREDASQVESWQDGDKAIDDIDEKEEARKFGDNVKTKNR